MYSRKFLKTLSFLFIILFAFKANAQDVEANVTIIHPKVQISNTQIFTSLKSSILQFVNQKFWCDDKLTNIERLKINFLIDIQKYDMNTNSFEGTIQIQATRPVYGSTYNTVLFNHLDNDLSFNYQEFQAMEFQQGANVFNLTGILAFYVNTIVGLNYDTYSSEGGSPYFIRAKEILNASQSINGWRPNDGQSLKNRYYLSENLLNPRFISYRKAVYTYHLAGLDFMHKDVNKGRDEILNSLVSFQELCRSFPNAMIFKVFFNAKQKELVEIFKGAPTAEQNKAIEVLSSMDPSNKSNYDLIKQK